MGRARCAGNGADSAHQRGIGCAARIAPPVAQERRIASAGIALLRRSASMRSRWGTVPIVAGRIRQISPDPPATVCRYAVQRASGAHHHLRRRTGRHRCRPGAHRRGARSGWEAWQRWAAEHGHQTMPSRAGSRRRR